MDRPAMSLMFIIIGAVFDFFDGFAARLLNVSSPIGKELDSLADDITFGLAPAAIVFSLIRDIPCPQCLAGIGTILPFFAFLIAAFSGLRLAKFNLDARQSTSFVGLPTPANALFWGSFTLGLRPVLIQHEESIYIVLILVLISCYMLIAEIKLFALKFKDWSWKNNHTKYVFLLTCIPLILLLGEMSLAAIVVWYVFLSLAGRKDEEP
jgi:CDP-diacylglycerol--serine O-phosphatidyltransferase